jgi:hypothetical protein
MHNSGSDYRFFPVVQTVIVAKCIFVPPAVKMGAGMSLKSSLVFVAKAIAGTTLMVMWFIDRSRLGVTIHAPVEAAAKRRSVVVFNEAAFSLSTFKYS